MMYTGIVMEYKKIKTIVKEYAYALKDAKMIYKLKFRCECICHSRLDTKYPQNKISYRRVFHIFFQEKMKRYKTEVVLDRYNSGRN